MERSLASWNESVLSRRRGLSGRFMSLSKRWTPFGGGSSRNSSGPLAGLQSSGGSSGNYDSLQGFYRPESPEATMRKLADYAVMLRDWKLAASTYDLLRSDFNSDKAWRYYAAACEMASVATLMDVLTRPGAASGSNKARLESLDTWLDAASYSYLTRCIAPFYALRALALAAELLRMRGNADDAARWHARVIESGLVAPVGSPLVMERVAAAYAAKPAQGKLRYGTRARKAAFWDVLATEAWLRLGKAARAGAALERVGALYGLSIGLAGDASTQEKGDDAVRPLALRFDDMRDFLSVLRTAVAEQRADGDGYGVSAAQQDADEATLVEEVSEKLDARPHRKSLSLAAAAVPSIDVLSPLSPARVKDKMDEGRAGFGDDHFE